MAASSSSSVHAARQDLADRLGEIRRDAALSGKDLAERLGRYPSKVSRIENARTTPSTDDVQVWCEACDAADQVADLVRSLRAVEGMFVEWRPRERDGLKQAQVAVRPLFDRTSRFRACSSWFVPGLIQSRACTEAVSRAVQQRRVAIDDVDAAVDARMERQRVLREPGKVFAFLPEESVLRSGTGGREVMVGQLGHLITAATQPNVSLGVIPERPDRTRMPVEGFWIFDSSQVTVELVSGYLTISQAHEVGEYVSTFAELSGHAVYGGEARAIMLDALRRLG